MQITSYYFNRLSPLQNHANNVVDRGSQFNTDEGKTDRKYKICCNKRIMSFKEWNLATKKAQDLEKKIKRRKITKR